MQKIHILYGGGVVVLMIIFVMLIYGVGGGGGDVITTTPMWFMPVHLCSSVESVNVNSPPIYIDGVFVSEGCRVLLNRQHNMCDNGIYVLKSGSLLRAHDAYYPKQLTNNRLVYVSSGQIYHDQVLQVTNVVKKLENTYSSIFFKPVSHLFKHKLTIKELESTTTTTTTGLSKHVNL